MRTKTKLFATLEAAQIHLANKINSERKGRIWTIHKNANGWHYVTEQDDSIERDAARFLSNLEA